MENSKSLNGHFPSSIFYPLSSILMRKLGRKMRY